MKIPQILAEEGVAIARVPRVGDGNGAGTGLAVLGQSLARVSQHLAVMGEAEQAKREFIGKTEANAAQAAFEVDAAAVEGDLRLTERDPDRYQQQSLASLVEVRAKARDRLTTQEGRAAFEARLPALLARHQIEALKHANTLVVDRAEGQLEATLDARMRLLGLATTDEERARHYGQGLTAIRDTVAVIGEKRGVERAKRFRDDFLMAEETRKISIAPDLFDARRLQGVLPDDKIQVLEQRAERHSAQALARQKRYEDDLAKRTEQERSQMVADLERKGLEGTLTLAELDTRQGMRQIEREEYRRLRPLALDGPGARPSDLGLLTTLSLDVHSMNPKASEGAIDRFVEAHRAGGRGLNLKDAVPLKDRLREQRKVVESQGESDLSRGQNQAEQVLRAGLGITSPLDILDEPTKKLYDVGLRELTARSRLFGGTEDPMGIIDELVKRLQASRGLVLTQTASQIRGTLRFATEEALRAAHEAGTISEVSYRLERDKFLRLNAMPPPELPPAIRPGQKPTPTTPRQ